MTQRPIARGSGRIGRPKTDSGLTELSAYLAVVITELDRLNTEREQLADSDRQAFLYNRHTTREYHDRFWNAVEKIIALPARWPTGLQVKANAIRLIQCMRDTSNSLSDRCMCDVGFRLAISLAADLQRWLRRAP